MAEPPAPKPKFQFNDFDHLVKPRTDKTDVPNADAKSVRGDLEPSLYSDSGSVTSRPYDDAHNEVIYNTTTSDTNLPKSVNVRRFPTITTLNAFHARVATNLVAAGRRNDKQEVEWYN